MTEGKARKGASPPVAYDGDQKLLAFLGAVGFVVGALFWFLLGLRLSGQGVAAAPVAFAASVACACFFVPAWGLRVKMQAGAQVTRSALRTMLAVGLVLGLGMGGLPYLTLGFKLADPEFMHLASEPENIPPALR